METTAESGATGDSTIRAYSRRFHNLYIFLTERCQLHCGHCYMGDRLARGTSFRALDALDLLRAMYNIGSEFVTFVGGEPTLHPRLPDLVSAANTIGYKKVMLDTNGLSRRRLADIDPRHLFYVRVSLDGASPTTHDFVRGAGSYASTITSIRWLVRNGYSTRITSTMFRFNLHEVFDLVALAETLGVRVLSFHTFSEVGHGASRHDWTVPADKWMSICEALEARAEGSLEVRWPPTWTTRPLLERYREAGYRGCLGCSIDRISVFPDGRCYICPLFFDGDSHFAVLSQSRLVLNRSESNEFNAYSAALLRASAPEESGCPAEATMRVGADGRLDLVSVCRLWRRSR